jgi:hypothetical protein
MNASSSSQREYYDKTHKYSDSWNRDIDGIERADAVSFGKMSEVITTLIKSPVFFQEECSYEKVWSEATVIKYVKSIAKWLINS